MNSGTTFGAFLAASIAATLWGCGSTPNTSGQTGGTSTGGTSAGGTSAGGTSTGGTGGSEEICVGSTVKGELVPIDIYIMLDRSGSMAAKTGPDGSGPTKWEAETTALKTFLNDPGSSWLGAGLQFFPLLAPGVPDTCTTSADCNGHGPCWGKACAWDYVVFKEIIPCDTNDNCPDADCTITLGQCQNNSDYACPYQANPPVQCGGGLGVCELLTNRYCINGAVCTSSDYANPAVEIAPLSDGAGGLAAALDSLSPSGKTPTYPALDGAVKHAQAWALAHPTHKVVTVLATDGLPTACNPTDIPSIAAVAQAGLNSSPSVLTFVIGVVAPFNVGAQDNLDQIAEAGGTTQAFLIQQNQDVTAAFLDALHQIQGQAMSCEYQIPTPPDGTDPDYGRVNVQYTPPGANLSQTIPYVASSRDCTAQHGGWYYDKDPAQGETPTKIMTCPATCGPLKANGGQIDIQMGCETIGAQGRKPGQ